MVNVNEVPALVSGLREIFQSGRTRALPWRQRQLSALRAFFEEEGQAVVEAVRQDLGRPVLEAQVADVIHVVSEIKLAQRKLEQWARPERVSTPAYLMPGSSRIYKDPLGVVLIIGPWNYPVQLVTTPLVGALAAGNCALVKPSELAPHVSKLLAEKLPQYLDSEAVKIVEGGIPETTALLEQKFDHIFYTGNGSVARIVMTAAAKHLTPVTLELGGKSPCIVDREINLEMAVRRICWGKFFNAGQTCVAPDYLLVHSEVHAAVLDKIKQTLRDFYGEDPKQSPDFGRIVNERHMRRLKLLLESGAVLVGGQVSEAERYMAPTVLTNVAADSPVMGEEIFGPILPVLKVGSVREAIDFVNARPKPLALYVFSSSDTVQQQVIQQTSSGGAVINHAWVHLGVPALPFGGVGESGMGAYHGRKSFDTFSHRKSVVKKPFVLDASFAYPPYSQMKSTILKHVI